MWSANHRAHSRSSIPALTSVSNDASGVVSASSRRHVSMRSSHQSASMFVSLSYGAQRYPSSLPGPSHWSVEFGYRPRYMLPLSLRTHVSEPPQSESDSQAWSDALQR